MSFLGKILVRTVAILITSYLLPGVHVENILTALIVAFVLALLNATLKPILIILTIPATVFTFGLFLLVINALVILAAGAIVPDFSVDGFWWALGFSIILSIINWILGDMVKSKDQKSEK